VAPVGAPGTSGFPVSKTLTQRKRTESMTSEIIVAGLLTLLSGAFLVSPGPSAKALRLWVPKERWIRVTGFLIFIWTLTAVATSKHFALLQFSEAHRATLGIARNYLGGATVGFLFGITRQGDVYK